jgi:hypothetical protein
MRLKQKNGLKCDCAAAENKIQGYQLTGGMLCRAILLPSVSIKNAIKPYSGEISVLGTIIVCRRLLLNMGMPVKVIFAGFLYRKQPLDTVELVQIRFFRIGISDLHLPSFHFFDNFWVIIEFFLIQLRSKCISINKY